MELLEGDFAVITRGQFHTLGDRLSTPVVSFFDLVKRHAPGKTGALSFGAQGPVTKLVCGGMLLENRRINPLLAILPPLLHIKRADEAAQSWLGFSTRQIQSELDNGRTGAKEIVNRLVDLLFILAVRGYFEQNIDTNVSGWLAGVRDPQIGEALAMLHRHPHQNWTVASLARRLAMSRSSFAARFTELVGEPPQQYCTRLRMHAAAVRLRTTTDKLSAVAAAAGYESESSLVRAFRRHTGMTPANTAMREGHRKAATHPMRIGRRFCDYIGFVVSVTISAMHGGEGPGRASGIEAIIPPPAADVGPMRTAFTRMVSKQWQTHVPSALRGWETAIAGPQFAKGRFIGEMYARACYSMLLVSRSGPKTLRIPVRASALLPQSRGLTIRFGSVLLMGLEQLLARAVHRQLLLTSALMGMLDVVLDDAASSGDAAALRIASLTAHPCPAKLLPTEQVIVALSRAARQTETAWQAEYWDRVLQPAVHEYCLAEVRAVEQAPDPTGMGNRWPGIEAAIKGMWYVVGPLMGLQGDPSSFDRSRWNREQHWMADTSLLMQMIDDWVDQDEDRGARATPVITGDWTLESAAALFDKTVRDLTILLDASGIQKPVLKGILVDLYKDYLHAALDAMCTGVAA